MKELSNGGGRFYLRLFTIIFYADDQILETINFRKAIYVDTNLLHYISFNGDATKFTGHTFSFFSASDVGCIS